MKARSKSGKPVLSDRAAWRSSCSRSSKSMGYKSRLKRWTRLHPGPTAARAKRSELRDLERFGPPLRRDVGLRQQRLTTQCAERPAEHLAALVRRRRRSGAPWWQTAPRRAAPRGGGSRLRRIPPSAAARRRRRNFSEHGGRSSPLRQHREPAIGRAAGCRANPLRDLQLEHQRQPLPRAGLP